MFTEIINETYTLLGIHHLNEAVKIVSLIFLGMIGALILFFFFTLFSLIFNRIHRGYRTKYIRFYHDQLMKFIMDDEIHMPEFPFFHEEYIREAMFDLLLITKGQEFKRLKSFYDLSGLMRSDLDNLKSPRWYKRLKSMTTLDQWKDCIGMEHLNSLIQDEYPLIRQTALKNLSRTLDEDEVKLLLLEIKNAKLHYSSLYEILHRLFINHQDAVFEAMYDPSAERLWPLIAEIAGENHSIESVPKLIAIAQNAHDHKTREKAIASLGKIGDPRSLPVLKSAIQSETSGDRLNALHSLMLIDSSEIKPFEENLSNDPDPLVRSWIHYYQRTGL